MSWSCSKTHKILITVHIWFHLDKTHFISLLIKLVPLHLKWWHNTLFNVHETLMKHPLGMALWTPMRCDLSQTSMWYFRRFVVNFLIIASYEILMDSLLKKWLWILTGYIWIQNNFVGIPTWVELDLDLDLMETFLFFTI